MNVNDLYISIRRYKTFMNLLRLKNSQQYIVRPQKVGLQYYLDCFRIPAVVNTLLKCSDRPLDLS